MRIVVSFLILVGLCWPASASYRFQPGDLISFSVWDDAKMDRQLLIDPNGRVSVPFAGQVKAAGKTASQLEAVLSKRLEGNYQSKPIVTIALIRVKPEEPAVPEQARDPIYPQIFVTGEVKKAGGYTIRTPTTVLQAIALAGGLDIYAAKRRIRIVRRGRHEEIVIPFDYIAVTSGRDPGGDFRLRNGDVVVVPERGLLKGLF